MSLLESIEVLNQRLVDCWGLAESTYARYRIVYSENELETRIEEWEDRTSEGFFIRRVYEARQVPKYRQWIQNKYVLEQLTIIPEMHRDNIGEKLSYEPVWVFEDKNGNPLPPKWEAIELIITEIMGNVFGTEYKGRAKYKDPESGLDEESLIAAKKAKIENLERELFGNETNVGDALAYKTGVVVPGDKNHA